MLRAHYRDIVSLMWPRCRVECGREGLYSVLSFVGQSSSFSVTPRKVWLFGIVALALFVVPLAGCGSSSSSSAVSGGKVRVVAAENFWGSIAAQVGGDHVSVTSVITNPATDPHDYEPTSQDARAFALAQYAIVNGAGYDTWAQQSLDANPSDGRKELDVAKLAGRADGDNPHMWYSPTIVNQVADQITSDLKSLDSAAYFDQQNHQFKTVALKQYTDLIASIKSAYDGTPVGATESIFEDMAPACGLNLLTPPSLMKAIAEGEDLTAEDKATMSEQIATKQIKVLIFNAQNTTNDVNGFVNEAKAANIPVVSITETLSPAGASFESWQVSQLQALQTALAQATGK
jgi:zinc/manganese transport system substrate-binding protein